MPDPSTASGPPIPPPPPPPAPAPPPITREIVAYSAWGFGVEIVPAPLRRDWMDATERGFAYQCLPMTLANQSGWFILAPHGAIAEWNGGPAQGDLRVEVYGVAESGMTHAASAVGSGILSWTIPYLFQTSPGWNLLCRGPANHIKDGVQALEGLVETDWSTASFSSNWKLTRPGRVEFAPGEPIAMLVPYARGDIESFRTRKAELSSNPALCRGYVEWITSRQAFAAEQLAANPPGVVNQRFQKHYFQGNTVGGVHFDDHQKKRRVEPFGGRGEG